MAPFTNLRTATILLITGMLLLVAWQAAGGEIKKRPPTSEEKDYFITTLRALKAAIPEAPGGWQIDEETGIKPLKRVFVGQEKIPFPVLFSITWIDPFAKKQSEKSRDQEEKLLQESREQAENADYMTHIDALNAMLKESNDRGDKQQSLNLQNQLNQLLNERDPYRTKVKESMERMKEELASPSKSLSITLEVNRFALGFNQGEVRLLDVLPDMEYYRTAAKFNDEGEWQEGISQVFLGRGWQRIEGESGGMQAVMPVGVLHTAVYTLVVSVQGEEQQAQHYLQKMDWQLLRALMVP